MLGNEKEMVCRKVTVKEKEDKLGKLTEQVYRKGKSRIMNGDT